MIKYTALLLSIFLIISCTSEPDNELPPEITSLPNLNVIHSNSKAGYELQLELDLTINQLDEMHIQGLWELYTDDEGNIFWQDNTISKVHKYSFEGDYIRSFGEEGRGPGEFQSFNSSTVYGKSLTGLDYINQKIQTFDTNTGDLIESATLEFDENISIFAQTAYIFQESDSTIIGITNNSISSKEDSISISRFAVTGELINDSVLKYPVSNPLEGDRGSGSFRTYATFTAKSETKLLPGGGFVHSHAGEPLFKFYDKDGNYQSAVYIEFEPAELTQEHIDYEIENSNPMIDMESSVKNAKDIPDYWPAWIDYLVADNGNIWVNMNTNPPHEREWWVFNQSGDLLIQDSLEELDQIRHIGSDYLFSSYSVDGVTELKRFKYFID